MSGSFGCEGRTMIFLVGSEKGGGVVDIYMYEFFGFFEKSILRL